MYVNAYGVTKWHPTTVSVSWDGGATWAANQTVNDGNSVFNFTNATTWTVAKTSNANFAVRIASGTGDAIDSIQAQIYYQYAIPTLYTPVNESTISTPTISFTWDNTSSGYQLQITNDSTFATTTVDISQGVRNYTTALPYPYLYFWRVRDSILGEYSDWSNVSKFTLNGDGTTIINGLVYEIISGIETPVGNARVIIQDNYSTWTNEIITSSGGYYSFSNLSNTTTYLIRATRADLYSNSMLYYVTTRLGTTTTQDIYMERCVNSQDCLLGTIDQNIMFQSYNASTHVTAFLSGYTAKIYEGAAVVPIYTMTTDSYGTITARLTTGTRYRLSLDNGDGINLIEADQQYIYPRIDGIVITIEVGTAGVITYPTNTSVTNTTNRSGSTGCGITCYNSSYLTSTTGVGPLGQGVLTSLIVWIVYGAGGAVTVLFTVAILAWLGILSWYVVFLFVLTGMSIYVLKEM